MKKLVFFMQLVLITFICSACTTPEVSSKAYNATFTSGLLLVANVDVNQIKYGYVNSKGRLVIPMDYVEASSFYEGVAFVSKNRNSYYIIDTKGEPINDIRYDRLVRYKNTGYFIGVKENSLFFISPTGEEIKEFNDILIDSDKTLRNSISINFDFHNDDVFIFPPVNGNPLYLINKDGERIDDNEYTYHHGHWVFSLESENNIIHFDRKGNRLPEVPYEILLYFSSGYAIVRFPEDTRRHIVNPDGDVVYFESEDENRYEEFVFSIYPLESPFAVIEQGVISLYDHLGVKVDQFMGINCHPVTNNIVEVTLSNGTGVVRHYDDDFNFIKETNEVIRFYTDKATNEIYITHGFLNEDVTEITIVEVSTGNKYVFNDNKRRIVEISNRKIITITKPGILPGNTFKCGLRTLDGKIIVNDKYDLIYGLYDAYYIVKNGNVSGLIDANGRVIIPLSYDGITPIA